ncbi:hypothetical protein N7535_007273 [Penicillium sp. DV-2018c]|nr:hypothetical protein N7535_007273 [Penicillium sp. DV-2018c]
MASLNTADDKSFVCPGCRKGRFASLGAVKAHFTSKGHELLCSPCDRRFGNVTALLKHAQQHEMPIDGSGSKSLGPSTHARKSMKQRRLQDLVDSSTPKPAESTPRQPNLKPKKLHDDSPTELIPTIQRLDKYQGHSGLLPDPPSSAELARNSKESKRSRDRSEARPVKISDTDKGQGGVKLPVINPKETVPKIQRSRKFQDRSESGSVKPDQPATKTIINEKAIRDLFGRSETAKDEGETDTGLAALNANYHVSMEVIEQDLIFRYLSARCHSITRLATLGFAFWDERAGVNRRLTKRAADNIAHYRRAPRSSHSLPKRRAIVIDCEMVRMSYGRREIAFLTAIDFLTGDVLINNYVKPDGSVSDWDTRYSGVTPYAMSKAVKEGTALAGRAGARAKLWEFMDSNTVLIGHGIINDLDALGIIHPNIVDSSIITSEAVFPTARANENLARAWSLKTLAKQLLDYDIQTSKLGHSALEDAHATRDVVIWCLRYPEHLKAWADNAREEEEARARARDETEAGRSSLCDPDASGLVRSAQDEVIPDDDLKHELESIQAAAASFF